MQEIPPLARNPDSLSDIGRTSPPNANTPETNSPIAQDETGSQIPMGSFDSPFPRIEREPLQLPIQRAVPAPRTASLNILERESRQVTEASPGGTDHISASEQESAAEPAATQDSSGEYKVVALMFPMQEPQHGNQNEPASRASADATPGTSLRPQPQLRAAIPQRRTDDQPPRNNGNVIEIWYGEKQVFQDRNAPLGKQPKSRGYQWSQNNSVGDSDNKPGEDPDTQEGPESDLLTAQNGDQGRSLRPADAGPSELGPVAVADEISEMADSADDSELFNFVDFSAPNSKQDINRTDGEVVPAALEFAPDPWAGHQDALEASVDRRRKSQHEVFGQFSDPASDAVGREIQQTSFEDAASSGSSGTPSSGSSDSTANVSLQNGDLQRDGGIPAGGSTEHRRAYDQSSGGPVQIDVSQLLASLGTMLWPVVAIAFGLMIGVAIVFLLLVIALRMIRPGRETPLCSVSIVNGDQAVDTGSKLATPPDQGTHTGVSTENGVFHAARRIRHSEPQPPVRDGFAKRMIKSAMPDSGFTQDSQSLPQLTEALVSHNGMMDDILRQNLAIRDQVPRKWSEN